MAKLKTRIGDVYGRLTVIERADDAVHPNGKKSTKWLCRCECGNKILVLGSNLSTGHTKSCGCLAKESRLRVKHGMLNENKRVYNIWTNMKQRCENENNTDYKNYGARGITICDEWHDPKTFCDWALKNGYSDDLTLDRIDNNGNYEPGNCRWTTMYVQRHNQRRLCDWDIIEQEAVQNG
jgi:hypothetical protein